MITLGDHNQFPSSFAPLGDLLKAFMFLSNLNGFNSSPSSPDQGFAKRKDSSKAWKERGSKWFCCLFSLFPSCFCFCTLLVCFAFMFWINLVLCIDLSYLTCFCLVTLQFCFILFFIKNFFWKIRKIQKQCVSVYIGTCVPWMAIETKFSKFCIFCSLEYPHQWMQKFCKFAHLKPTFLFYFTLLFLQNAYINLSIIHIIFFK